ncbi:probable receptor-like serine/threonine-protein kinase At4g34500 [Olea europaea var. sylvestris]|uniref:probable receptor-like serine/threonine-protein kinase At4g34500 n=1 Tax=Olea europaea var. sylvestris TaxID=158386 RepID=UPI000C1D4C50|nr:probable receptor-like serine/threonine-protein kinase At4g34500 [Olea europaea var. sylvestris]
MEVLCLELMVLMFIFDSLLLICTQICFSSLSRHKIMSEEDAQTRIGKTTTLGALDSARAEGQSWRQAKKQGRPPIGLSPTLAKKQGSIVKLMLRLAVYFVPPNPSITRFPSPLRSQTWAKIFAQELEIATLIHQVLGEIGVDLWLDKVRQVKRSSTHVFCNHGSTERHWNLQHYDSTGWASCWANIFGGGARPWVSPEVEIPAEAVCSRSVFEDNFSSILAYVWFVVCVVIEEGIEGFTLVCKSGGFGGGWPEFRGSESGAPLSWQKTLGENGRAFSAFSNWTILSENLIGKGGSSQVYRGCLPEGKELAVKILKPSEDVLEHFVSEIEIITSLHHSNIISLVGICFEENNLLLVYNLLSRGSLEDNLHGPKKTGNSFCWEDRYKVALGIAEALDYIHNAAVEPIIHRDVKSSNILLSDAFEPQLSDFGLATWASSSSRHIDTTDVAGTFGYLAPEYFMHGKLNENIDVYAFGVVLLELLSGRKPIDNELPKGEESLVMWANRVMKDGKISQLLDPNLTNAYDYIQFEKMVLAAILCIRRAPQSRPQISLILELLQGDPEALDWATEQVNASDEVDSVDGEQSGTNLQSFINLALLNLEEGSGSSSSTEQNILVEDYLQGRCSHSSSFD